MTFRQGLAKKFGPRSLLGRLIGPNIYARVWHSFRLFAAEYEKDLKPEERQRFRKVFGEP